MRFSHWDIQAGPETSVRVELDHVRRGQTLYRSRSQRTIPLNRVGEVSLTCRISVQPASRHASKYQS
jgi:hypothetical protein